MSRTVRRRRPSLWALSPGWAMPRRRPSGPARVLMVEAGSAVMPAPSRRRIGSGIQPIFFHVAGPRKYRL